MIRTLLATTALTALMAGTAFAQSETQTDPMNSQLPVFAPDQEMSGDMDVSVETDTYFQADASQVLSSDLLGQQIYTGTSDDAEVIGDVNDLLMASDGDAQAVVVGVGGFLGIGEKEVAVDFARLNWVEMDGDRRLYMDTTAEELENAPAFDRAVFDENLMETAQVDTGMGTDTTGIVEPTLPGDELEMDMTAETGDMASADDMDTMDGMTTIDPATLSAEELIGARVYGSGDEDIGEIGDVLLSENAESVEAYIVDVGGFLGIGEKPVGLAAADLTITSTTDGQITVHTPFTEEQLNNQPAYSEEAYQQNPDQILIR